MLSLSDSKKQLPVEGRTKPLSTVEAGKKAYIVAVKGSRVMLGRGMAGKIIVV